MRVNVVLRALLRDTAQSVAVVTTTDPSKCYFGATLSSFASVALDPHPLVTFSLRVPSRTATALTARSSLVINILSAAQPHIADRFAHPDQHPRPFHDPLVPWTLSPDHIPILSGALGALSCRLVAPSLPLARLGLDSQPDNDADRGTGLASELFIARVLRVEPIPLLDEAQAELHRLPLLYHRRRYTTVRDGAD